MTDPQTSNRNYAVQTHGSNVNSWDSPLNSNFALIDNNFGGLSTVSLSSSNVVLNSAQYQCGTIRLSGILTANVNVTFPAVQGWWTIDNQTTGEFVATITIGSGQVIAVEQGVAADILIDGTNVKFRNLPAVGTYLDVCDATVPSWITACTVPPYLNCDGTTFSAITYPYLNTKLGGNTLPDIRGGSRATLNQGTSRITTAGSGIDGNTRFSRGGAESVTLNTSQIPAHTHVNTLTDPGHTHGYQNNNGGQAFSNQSPGGLASNSTTAPSVTNITINNASAGGGALHTNMGPTTISGITLIRAA